MTLLGLGSSFPKFEFTQIELLEKFRESPHWERLRDSSRRILATVLSGDSGIDTRRFEVERIEEAWERDAQELNECYEKAAPGLGRRALEKALDQAKLKPSDLDALFVSSCTGYLCPGVSSHLAEGAGLQESASLQDSTGLGCGAAIPLLRDAAGFLALHPGAKVATVSVEICSAAFYIEDDPGVLISACLFGDGAAASIWSDSGGDWQAAKFRTLHQPQNREHIRFTNARGFLRNQLHSCVPKLAREAVAQLHEHCESRPDTWISHGGGRDVIEELESIPACPGKLNWTRSVMRDYGNLSSPAVIVALERFLKSAESHSADSIWMTAFGAGFSAHSCELRRAS